jgi:AcrR family transcriptional regulator
VTNVSTEAAVPEPSRPGIDPLRHRLIEAAAAVFAAQGYEGTKIMDVVRRSGLSTGAVYGRFRSKNELLREAVITYSSRTDHLGMADVERVADLITRTVAAPDQPLNDTEALRLEASVAARREPEVAEALSAANEVFKHTVAPLVEAARHDGTLADDVDAEAALFLVRILNLGMLLHRASGVPSPDGVAWSALLDRIVASMGTPGALPAGGTPDTPDPAPEGASEASARCDTPGERGPVGPDAPHPDIREEPNR